MSSSKATKVTEMNRTNGHNTLTTHITVRVAVIVWLVWAVAMASLGLWQLFETNWFMSATMAVGSFIAGSTSEGGGAVAFPVMTLIFGIAPAVARDFSLMIQSVGMTAAALTIFATGIQVDLPSIKRALIGALPGFIIGSEWISPVLPPAVTKVFFVSFWLAFGLTLHFHHRHRSPARSLAQTQSHAQGWIPLALLGLVGGAATGLTGCGLDIVVFSYLVLRQGLNEKIATPTSVVLMASISIIGFAFRALISDTPISPEAWNHWWVSVPVVVVGAPLGAIFISTRSRNFVISILVTAICVQFIGALLIIPMTPIIIATATTTFMASGILFMGLTGKRPHVNLPDETSSIGQQHV